MRGLCRLAARALPALRPAASRPFLPSQDTSLWRLRTYAISGGAGEAPGGPDPVDLSLSRPTDPSPFAAVTDWVVFSDLHVCDRTLPASLAALQAVRHAVEARGPNAGALFLGDFWHARGALPVTPLNAVLDELALWRHPTIMLVGNHDQVSAGGLEHALSPLAAALPCGHVFDRPTLFLGALWLPYRRSAADHVAAVAAAMAEGPSAAPTVVFAHADVAGAVANDTFQSAAGLDPSLFPAATWLGHYHKPHTIKRAKGALPVRYVGSPYQVSAGEAGQDKALVVLKGRPDGRAVDGVDGSSSSLPDCHSWALVDTLPLDVGPRHFVLTGKAPTVPDAARPGDRIRWTVPASVAPAAADAAAAALRVSGASVDVALTPPRASPRLAAVDGARTPGAMFDAYADHVNMSPAACARGAALLTEAGGGGAPPPGCRPVPGHGLRGRLRPLC